jgi:prepilin-type N-terminal cleavage/methylation domain-containing protein
MPPAALPARVPGAGRPAPVPSHGFTLVELLVVIAIISVLAALLLPALEEALTKARMVDCQNRERQIYLAVATYTGDYRSRLPTFMGYFNQENSHVWANTWKHSPTWKPGWLGHLYQGRYLAEDFNLVLCPGTVVSDKDWYKHLFTYPVDEWPIPYNEHKGARAYANYALAPYAAGRPIDRVWEQKGGPLFAEAVGAFTYPKAKTVTHLHGDWPGGISPTSYSTPPLTGLGTMNMALFDGSVEAVPNWAHYYDQGWNQDSNAYYWPCNDRSSWQFWKVFRRQFP